MFKAIHTLRGLKQCCVPPEAHQGPLATWLKTGGKRTWYKYLTEQQKEGYHTMFSNISDSRFMSRLDPESKLCTEDRISQVSLRKYLPPPPQWMAPSYSMATHQIINP